MRVFVLPTLAASLFVLGCSDEAGSKSVAVDPGTGDTSVFDSGTELRVLVPDSGRVYVKLGSPAVVMPVGDPAASSEWDIAFEGFDVFTNSGVSGRGQGAAFGPLDAITFISDTAPSVPFFAQDKAGGAFLDWYAYEGASHALWSRYHIYGVRDGSRRWKLQILSYYGQRDGAAISALYQLRYAELFSDRIGPTRDVADLDGTAGGVTALESAPSECLDLESGERMLLTPADARDSPAWHVCFRRDSISVNGGIGGPRGTLAADLDADKAAGETIDGVKVRTPEGERPAFDAAVASSFASQTFRGDRVISAFSDGWIDAMQSPFTPTVAAWLVQDAAGAQKFLIGFASFENPTATSLGTVVVRIKPVKG